MNIFKNQSDVICVNFTFHIFPSAQMSLDDVDMNAASVRSVCSLECSNAGVEIVFVTPLNYGRSF